MSARSPRARRLFQVGRAALRVVRPLVPAGRRREWVQEWESELWHRLEEHERAAPIGGRTTVDLTLRLLGALPHALWLRREEWRLDMIGQDLLYAFRTLRKRPGFVAIVVGTLALGIGANTAMFTIVNSVLLQPLPFQHPEQLVSLNGSFSGGDEAAISPPDFLDYRAANTVFSSFAGRVGGNTMISGDGDPERVATWAITSNFFSTLGVAPLIGRGFLPNEEEGTGHDVLVLSNALWKRRFGGDPRVLGKSIIADGHGRTIVGVMPPLLDRTFPAELWRPIEFHMPNTSIRRFHFMRAVGRLKPGVSIPAAKAAMDVVSKQLEITYPENASWRLRLRSYREVVVGDVGRALTILLGAVGLVLLIACGNVASLQLARATARQGEIALRTALGASRTRLIRQLLTESLLLAVAGGAAGLALAWVVIRGVRVMAEGILPRLAEIRIDPTVLVFTGVVSLATGLIFGLAPAIHAARSDLARSLSTLGRGTGSGGSRARDLLVVAQMGLSLMLLIGAGLLFRSLVRLQNVDAGFDARGVMTAQINLPDTRYPDRPAQLQFATALLARLRAIPGVQGASAATVLPLMGGGDTYYYVDGHPPASDRDRKNAQIDQVAEGYFETMGIGVAAGRTFGATERAGGPPAVIISKVMAEREFHDESPLGKRLVVDFGKPLTAEIVGVVADVKSYGFDGPVYETMYFSTDQATGFGLSQFNLVVRDGGDPMRLIAPIRAVLGELDREIPLIQPQTMEDVVRDSMSQQRFGTRLLGGFALSALLLAVVGLYGVLAYAVAQRTRELGIRLALGAGRAQLFGLVLRRGMMIVASGTVLGLLGALAATRLMRGMLFEVGPTDPLIFGVVTLVLVTAGLVACLAPARRATRVNPIVALRAEQ